MTITRMVLMAWMGGTVAQGSQPPWTVDVYVHKQTNVPCEILKLAEGLATKMFAEIGIRMDWRAGRPVRESVERPILIELAESNSANIRSGVLAQALPFEGTQITVFFDRLAADKRPAEVLGHVMVHEITHLLQGISRHSDIGVMKAQWTCRDRFEMLRKPLAFTTEDVDLIYLGLAKRTAPTVTAAAER